MRYSQRFPPDPRWQALFSTITDVHGWVATHWRVELYDHGNGDPGAVGRYAYPRAVAWVTIYRDLGPVLEYLFVVDHHRGGRVGPYLMAECERRWPDLQVTDRIDATGNWRGAP